MNKPDDASATGQAPSSIEAGDLQRPAASEGDGIDNARALGSWAAESDGTLFEVLGHHLGQFYFRVLPSGAVVWLTAAQMQKPGALLAVVPDIDHWRSVARDPRTRAGVDWRQASAALIARSYEVGPFHAGAAYRWPSITEACLMRLPRVEREAIRALRLLERRAA